MVQWVHGQFWKGWEEVGSQDRVLLELNPDDKCCLIWLKPNHQLLDSEWLTSAAAEVIPPIFSSFPILHCIIYTNLSL